jgi:hypothetical protein
MFVNRIPAVAPAITSAPSQSPAARAWTDSSAALNAPDRVPA